MTRRSSGVVEIPRRLAVLGMYRGPQRVHHRIVMETPLMHRHELEWQLEELWDNHGIEYKFLQSTTDMSALDFYGALSSSVASITEASSSAAPARKIMTVQSVAFSPGDLPSLQISAQDVPVRNFPRRSSGVNPVPR